jgi:molybdenum cofactor biosynthesis enzyme MoaA
MSAALETAGVGDVRIAPAEPALEELFVQIVRREEGEEAGTRGQGSGVR